MSSDPIASSYESLVELNYQLYNGLFLTLPLDAVEQTGLLLPLLEEACHDGLGRGVDPRRIIEEFFTTHRPGFSADDKAQFLFKVIQYVERQIVLIDALEDASFTKIHQTRVRNELRKLIDRANADGLDQQLQQLLGRFSARVILTAHPTQFYPGPVLAIISDLTGAIEDKDIARARSLLQQLGNTPFFNKEKPSPFDEAVNLGWYLANIFYPAISAIGDRLAREYGNHGTINRHLLSVGFWPGGDRDGNPFVTAETTAAVANKLRNLIVSCYHEDVRELKRRLSFRDVY
ncbi:MAG: phosphoenolpyruvate carboxylase, partial [Gammaproteobacteria bacterium]